MTPLDYGVEDGDHTPLCVGRITVHPESYEVYVDRERVELTLTQFRLIHAMAKRPGWVVSAEQFNRRFGQPSREAPATNANIKHHIAALRRKLGPGAVQVQTVRGQGYRLTESSPTHRGEIHADQSDS
ncbi:winged helix-turn-helix domain-containing protein [Algisphaera agarilytica]|uniref:DNA-binding response OmpR family regulator n=1 Tax=Algisphaera agarilytica TaxID=1385975 RepID=A0A7X0H690_9BACT|nr:winged helix-turn-helix domain-containing protein [Algisphaera agarilytica]MBB6430076.1 DNA-binding response OmpR family regulator [Algisphaera agarilytica]